MCVPDRKKLNKVHHGTHLILMWNRKSYEVPTITAMLYTPLQQGLKLTASLS